MIMSGFRLSTVVVSVLLLIGWVLNIIAIAEYFQLHTSADVPFFIYFRVVGILVYPLGGVLGYI